MSSPRVQLLLLDAAPSKGHRGHTCSRTTSSASLQHMRNRITATNIRTSANFNLRLPSVRPIDKRWDRSRSIMLRSAEQNLLRDFRWTSADPITFCETPASSRGYARREIPRRSDPSPAQNQTVRSQRDALENPNDFRLTSNDREMQLQEQVKRMEENSLSNQQRLNKANETIRTVETNLSEARQRIKNLEDDTKRQRREMEKLQADRSFELATERKKTRKEVEAEYRGERESSQRARIEQEAAFEEREQILRQQEVGFDALEVELREKARVDALSAAESAYVGQYAELDRQRDELRKAQTNLEEKEAMFDYRVAEAEAAARDEVKLQAEELIVSASLNEQAAKEHLSTATQLQKDAARIERKAIDARQRQSQDSHDLIKRMSTNLERISNTARSAVKEESDAALAEFRKKRENAEYREQVERNTYDDYREVWERLRESSVSLISAHFKVVDELRRTASAWRETSARFHASEILPSFPAKYPELSAEIQRFLDTACERATDAADRAERNANDVVADMLRGHVSRGHYSRMLTRFHRFNKAQGKAEMAKVLKAVFGEPLIANLRRETERKQRDLENQPRKENDATEIEDPQAERVKIDRALRTIDASRAFLSTLSNLEVWKNLREDSVFEKELEFATRNLSLQMGAAKMPWRQFVDSFPSAVVGSEVDRDAQTKDRSEIKVLHGDMSNDFNSYHKSIWERSVLRQQLGEGGKQMARINARIDREGMEARNAVQRTLDRLTGQRSSQSAAFRADPSAARIPIAHQRRSVRSSRVRVASRTPPAIERIAKPVGDQTRSIGQLESDVAKLKGRLKNKSSYNNDKELHEDRAALERTRLELMRVNIENLKKARSALEKDPSSNAEKLEENKTIIANLETRLAKGASASGSMLASARASRVTRQDRRHRRAARLATSTSAPSMSKSESTSTHGSDTGAPNKPDEAATPSLNLTPTASKQSWRRRWPYAAPFIHGNVLKTETETLSRDSNAAMLSSILGLPHRDAPPVPMALQVYSLHSLHTTAFPEQLGSETEEFPELSSTSILPSVPSFDDQLELTQSTAETVSDPESAYEPSDSEASVSDSQSVGLAARLSDLDISSSQMSNQEFVDALESQSPFLPDEPMTAAVQPDPGLTYNISPEDYRRAALASKSSNAAFWTYKLYKNPEGKTPTIHYCTNFEAAEAQAKQFLDEPVLGFDLEWEMGAVPGKSSIKDCVSLVQIASETKIGLFQLSLFKGDTVDKLMPSSLRQILESQEVAKTGVNVSGDASRIEKCFGFQVRGLFELSHLYNVVTWSERSPERVNKKLLNLADQVQNVLLLPLKKDKVRTSQWSKRLRLEQTEYAASDAYAGFRLYHALEARRTKMNPMPPRPAFWEEKKPLILGDGTAVVPRRIVKKKVGDDGKVVEDEEEEEEYFDAVETLDPYELDTSETAGIPLAGLSISYPTLPTLDDLDQPANATEDGQARAAPEQTATTSASSEPAKEDPKPRPTALTSPAVAAADSWAQTFRSKLPATHNLSKKQAHLRAYHLWHYQSHDCKAVATLLRDPPLSVTTVASYVLQAVSEGKDLDFDKDRFVAAMEVLPPSVRGRYWWVVERLERAEMEREVGRRYD